MFDHRHYVPVLRWKQAEWLALRDLANAERARIPPLLEFVPQSFGSPCEKMADQILRSWGHGPFFAEYGLLDDPRVPTHASTRIRRLAEEALRRNLCLIPVTGLDRTPEYQSAVRTVADMCGRGVCIRLQREDTQRSQLRSALTRLLDGLGHSEQDTHLVADYRLVEAGAPDLRNICSGIPGLHTWQTLSVTCGAFPPDLSRLQKNRRHILPRADWLNWRNQVLTMPSLPRIPTFGDYTIQNPRYAPREGPCNYSASIRYTTDEHWIVMRGEGVFNVDGPGFDQYHGNAVLLCASEEYSGPDFSAGDRYIAEKQNPQTSPGNAASWLRAGFNHHLTFVARQISNLFAS
ncbi:MAG: beta family protein [Planctomycetota bacterium]